MISEFYHNIGIKGYFKRYGFVNAIKRGVFIVNPFHVVKDSEVKKLLWQKKATKKIRKYFKFKDVYPQDLQYKNVQLEDPIWIYWHSGMENAPDIVKACYFSIKKYADREIITLSEGNLEQYVKLPDYIKEKKNSGKISMAAYTDLIRTALLSKFGGLWIDSTVYLTNKIPPQIIEQDFFVFSNTLGLIDNPVLHPLWFLRAKEQNEIIEIIRNVLFAYWVKEKHVVEYLLPNIVVTEVLKEHEYAKNMYYLNSDYSEYFVKILGEDYDEKKFGWVKKLSDIHKLTYKLDDSIEREGSFYYFLTHSK